MEKIVKGGDRFVEITLDGTECAVKFDSKYSGFEVYNTSGGEVIVSVKSGGVKGDDGVISIADGEDVNYMHMRRLDTVYITGTGVVKVCAKNEATRNFIRKQGGGDNGGITSAKTIILNSYYDLDIAATGILTEEE